jgi:hypothetical protein
VTTKDNSAIAAQVKSHIERLREAPTHKRDRIVNELITILYPHFGNWAPTFCRVSGDVHGQQRDDIISVVAEHVLGIIREAAEPGKHEGVSNWYSYLYGASRYASLAYFGSSKVTAASGMTSLLRKQRHIARTRATLRGSLGREPMDVEIIDAANQDMRERRSNPEKQGALVDLSDLNIILPTADVADHDRALSDTDETSLLAPVEGQELVTLIVNACTEISVELGAVAHVWIGGSYAEPPVLGTSSDVAREVLREVADGGQQT